MLSACTSRWLAVRGSSAAACATRFATSSNRFAFPDSRSASSFRLMSGPAGPLAWQQNWISPLQFRQDPALSGGRSDWLRQPAPSASQPPAADSYCPIAALLQVSDYCNIWERHWSSILRLRQRYPANPGAAIGRARCQVKRPQSGLPIGRVSPRNVTGCMFGAMPDARGSNASPYCV